MTRGHTLAAGPRPERGRDCGQGERRRAL